MLTKKFVFYTKNTYKNICTLTKMLVHLHRQNDSKSSSKNSSCFDIAKVLKQYETYKQSKRKVKRFGNDVPSV